MISFSEVIFDFNQLVNVMRSEVPSNCFYWSEGVAMSINDRHSSPGFCSSKPSIMEAPVVDQSINMEDLGPPAT
ncbi:hypothetical protein TNCV_4208081 [Trichonephila clavipes]|nr:hypothetical protein TNCV_4208081 [Trichonephila clavipes]